MMPSSPAPSNCSNHCRATSTSCVAGVTCTGGAASARACSSRARRSVSGDPVRSSSPSASRSKAIKLAGVSRDSRVTRLTAGWIRCCSASKSSVPRSGSATTISPSITARGGKLARTASTTSGKYRVIGRSLRLPTSTSSPSLKTMARKPSHFGSYSCPPGMSGAGLASMGATGGITGRATAPVSTHGTVTCQDRATSRTVAARSNRGGLHRPAHRAGPRRRRRPPDHGAARGRAAGVPRARPRGHRAEPARRRRRPPQPPAAARGPGRRAGPRAARRAGTRDGDPGARAVAGVPALARPHRPWLGHRRRPAPRRPHRGRAPGRPRGRRGHPAARRRGHVPPRLGQPGARQAGCPGAARVRGHDLPRLSADLHVVDGGLVDLHVHFMPDRVLRKVWDFFDRAGEHYGMPWPVQYRGSETERLETLASLGVTTFAPLVYAHKPGMARWLTEWAVDFGRRTPGAVPTATIFPEPDVVEYLAQALDQGARCVNGHVQVGGFDPRDPLLAKAWGLLPDTGVPVVVGLGKDPGKGAYTGLGVFEQVLAAHPGLVAVLAHAGMPDFGIALDLMARYPQLHL